MLSVKFFAYAFSAQRNFSTKTSGKSIDCVQDKYKFRPKPKNPRVKWTEQQKQIISAISEGKSVFITGSAGTGKTMLVKHIIKLLKRCHTPSKVFVTAPTGVAACAISGQTLHSFAGIGCGNDDRDTLLSRVLSNKEACRKWSKAEALVIDEISMVDGELLDSLEYIAKYIRQVDEIWGGMQLVVGGDFFQLPPVKTEWNSESKEFAFEADCWESSFDLQVNLTKVFRQSDPRLIKILQGIRTGEIDPEDLKFLENSCADSVPDPSAVQFYPRIQDVNRVNASRLESLGNELVVYTSVDSGHDPWKRQLEQVIAPKEIGLCKDARVMLLKNLNTRSGLVNGATGTVMAFRKTKDVGLTSICDGGLLPIVKFDSGIIKVIKPKTWDVTEGDSVVAQREQLPLRLAWASSIHKCQGMTLDCLYTDLSKSFGYGMVYVTLSRVKSLEGLYISGFHPSKIKVHPKVKQFYKRFSGEHEKEVEDKVTQKKYRSNDSGGWGNKDEEVDNDNAIQKKYCSNDIGRKGNDGSGYTLEQLCGKELISQMVKSFYLERQLAEVTAAGLLPNVSGFLDQRRWALKLFKSQVSAFKSGLQTISKHMDMRKYNPSADDVSEDFASRVSSEE
ncbi:hypothetical protein PS2_024275 [Malus domestica]